MQKMLISPLAKTKKMFFSLFKPKNGKKLLKKSLKKGIINSESAKWHSFLILYIYLKKRPPSAFIPALRDDCGIHFLPFHQKAVPVNSRTLTD